MDEQNAIEITTYVNPHIFWIVFKRDIRHRAKLETFLQKEKHLLKKAHIIHGLAIVIDNLLYKRALVKNFDKETNKYECWLLDYGKILSTQTVFDLPKDLASQPALAQSAFALPACLYNIVPIKSVLDIELNKCIYEKQINFDEGTIKVAREVIHAADYLTFHVHSVLHKVLCGSLELTVKGKNINMIDMLIKNYHVAKDQQLFLQAMKLNFNIISQNNIDNSGLSEEILSHSISEGVGRSCLRTIKRDISSPGSNNPYVSKWLLQNRTKTQVSCSRRPTTLCIASSSEDLPASRISSISNDSNSKRDSKSPITQEIESRICEANNSSTNAVKENEENINTPDISSHQSTDFIETGKHTAKDICVENKSRLPPNMIKHESEEKIQEINVPLANSKDTNVDSNITFPKVVDFKTFVKGRGKSTPESLKQINVRKCIVPGSDGVRSVDGLLEIKRIIKGRGTSKAIISKVESNEISKDDYDSWDDINESDSYSQDTTDFSLNKSSSEDSSADPLSHIPTSSESLPCNREDKLIAAGPSRLPSADGGEKLLSALSSSESDAEVPIKSQTLRKKFKFGCQCENCLKWETNDFAEDEHFCELKTIPIKVAYTPPPFLKTEQELAYDIQMKKIERTQTKIEKDIAPCLLVHSLQLPRYASGVVDVAFCQSVHRSLNHLNLKNAYTIQSYAWPAIMRSMNVCLLGAPQSGKSLCYLPAICTFVIEKQSRYCELPTDNGPIAVVLCESLPKAEEIYNLFITILKHTREKVAIGVVIPPTPRSYMRHIKSSDILVTTPRVLINLLKSRLINFKRLCHFVMEDADKLLAKYGNEIDTLTKGIQSMISHRVCFYGVQVITLSTQWTRSLETFLKRLDNVPMICISSYLQCAVYGRASIQMHFVSSSVKVRSICDIVKENSRTFKTVIVCNDDSDVTYISNLLQIEGASVTYVTSYMMAEEILEQEVLWNSTNSGRHSVLICTDVTLNSQLSITQAEILIHYSLPQEHWTLFSRRFKCLLDNYGCPFNSKFQPGSSCKIHIYVSEDCSKQYPRLCRFLTDMGVTLPPKFADFSMNIERKEEQEKIEKGISLCKRLKLLGNCNKFRCDKRHMVDRKLDLHNWIPTAGVIKFKILNVQDATVFSVRLLEHIDINGNIHKMVDNINFVTHDLSNEMRNNKISATDFYTADVYVWFDDEIDIYHRCKVLKILSNFKITNSPREILIKLIDAGKEKRVQTANVYKLPRRYVDLPPQSLDVYLANILPPDEDEHWSMRTKNKVSNIIDNANLNRDHCYYTGRILLQIGETLWLDDIKLQEDLEYSNDIITILPLKRKLLEMELCSEKKCQLDGLYEVCQNCSVDLPKYELKPVSNVQKPTKQVEPQWAFLEDDYNVVYFCSADSPSKFYVRQQKYQKLFQQLQCDIQLVMKQPFYPKIKDIFINNCYLAQDPEGDEYARVIVRNIEDDMVDCFFVDFGDYTKVQRGELKFLPDDLIARLPFQAIECSLFGVEPILDCWAYEATDIFYDHCFETNTDIYKNLYIKYFKLTQPEKTERNIYSVILLDYVSDKPIFINNILIDCGFAATVKDEPLIDLTLPNLREDLEEEDNDDWNVDSVLIEFICFSTIKGETEYKLNFQLFGHVNPTFQHIGGGPLVRITLTKVKPGTWERLTFSTQKMRNIRYDMSKYVFPEEKKELFLTIEKNEEEEADDNEIIVDIGSDIDYSESDIETDFDSD
ncbi:hypothetical protein MML48_1g08768 [Holotrichia oblita]|uniref:Uncharacterized protein n=1 Tax=Holotrichia oblita TaxID=644536 RepID=A0ACB9TV66_HOLOL|nr:hypothetical protein MML48_1g08768 [Holotrichia oblita]